MKVLVVFDHPRRNSFGGAILDELVAGLGEAGHGVEIADLYREGFDPRMIEADEPDWGNPQKRYSEAVLAEQARVERADAIVFVFPVWWWSVPAMTKGWIDRVWNHGWAYGGGKLKLSRAMMVATGSSDADSYAKRGYDAAMRTQLLTGVLKYCGTENVDLVLMLDATGAAEIRAGHLAEARRLGREFA
ncbi:MAG: NAD(P)H oxidoreductase [Hyphomicrobiaceae bacterium]